MDGETILLLIKYLGQAKRIRFVLEQRGRWTQEKSIIYDILSDLILEKEEVTNEDLKEIERLLGELRRNF